MLVGYNTNVPYKGTLYHVQTEDNGLKNPIIITLLYLKGTILASKKVSYAHFAASPDYKEKVRELMKEQHKSMIKELIRGRHTGDSGGEDSPSAACSPAPGGAEGDQGLPAGGDLGSPPSLAATAMQAAPAGENPLPKARISGSLDDVLLDFIRMKKEDRAK